MAYRKSTLLSLLYMISKLKLTLLGTRLYGDVHALSERILVPTGVDVLLCLSAWTYLQFLSTATATRTPTTSSLLVAGKKSECLCPKGGI